MERAGLYRLSAAYISERVAKKRGRPRFRAFVDAT
jgi:hypothetical protein